MVILRMPSADSSVPPAFPISLVTLAPSEVPIEVTNGITPGSLLAGSPLIASFLHAVREMKIYSALNKYCRMFLYFVVMAFF